MAAGQSRFPCASIATDRDERFCAVCKDLAVTLPAGSKFNSADATSCCVHRQMHLAPLASARRSMLTLKPFSITSNADPSAVDQQVQRLARAPTWDLCSDPRLTAAQRRKVGHRSVQPGHFGRPPSTSPDQTIRFPEGNPPHRYVQQCPRTGKPIACTMWGYMWVPHPLMTLSP